MQSSIHYQWYYSSLFVAAYSNIQQLNHHSACGHFLKLNQCTCYHNYSPIQYTGCPRRNVQDFRRVFLMLYYTDITQNTYIQSWTVTEIMAIEKCGLLGSPRTVRSPWRHTRPLCMPGNETSLANIVMQWPWWVRYKITDQLRPV